MIRHFFKIVLILLILASCAGSNRTYRIGVDGFFSPLELRGREKQVVGFSTDLLRDVSQMRKMPLEIVNGNSTDLLWGLKEKKIDAILSSMQPYSFELAKYDFSDIFLQTGPVLVVAASSNITNLNQLSGKEIGVENGSSYQQILEPIPGILIRNFASIPQGLNDVVAENLDGAVIDLLSAKAYIQDLYQGQLKIATAPLRSEGLRIVTLHGQAPNLIKNFNTGVKKLQSGNQYVDLLKKWGLADE